MTSRRLLAELDQTCLEVRYDAQLTSLVVQLECMAWLRDNGYPVDAFENVHTGVSVKTHEDDTGYIVGEVQTLSRPTEIADATEDKAFLWACSCPDFHYRRFPGLSEGESIESVGECAHVSAVKRQSWSDRELDDNQNTLTENHG